MTRAALVDRESPRRMTYAKDPTPPFYHDTRADLRVTRTCRTRAIQTERADRLSARMGTMPFTVSERSIDTLRTSRMKSGASADVGPETSLGSSWALAFCCAIRSVSL